MPKTERLFDDDGTDVSCALEFDVRAADTCRTNAHDTGGQRSNPENGYILQMILTTGHCHMLDTVLLQRTGHGPCC